MPGWTSNRACWQLVTLLLLGCGSRTTTPVGETPRAAPAPEPAMVTTPTSPSATSPPAEPHRVQSLQIVVLSTSVAPQGVSEWGFAALVEADGHRILFDTGARPDTVKRNAKTLGIDLATVPTVVLSHHHDDHVGGLLTLRQSVLPTHPDALATVHVGRGIFEPRRYGAKTHEVNDMLTIRPAFEATGGRFVEHAEPAMLVPGVWVTGPVPRVHPERNYSGARRLPGGDGWIEDTLPESQSLVIETTEGLVLLSGCGHAGIVNTVTHARDAVSSAPLHAAVGGFHLHRAKPEHLRWTAAALREAGLDVFAGAHCTGRRAIERVGRAPGVASSVELGVGEAFVLGADEAG
ncbi:MAG: MBL fold metallo-hydrolase [Myxococcota bacterium]